MLLKLLARYKSNGSCMEWAGAVSSRGYGTVYCGPHESGERLLNGRLKIKLDTPHRLMYELVNGPVPNNMFVCHTCDNRICFNPSHLFLGTAKDNMLDMVAKGRWSKSTRKDAGRKGGTATWANILPEDREAKLAPMRDGFNKKWSTYGLKT